MEEPEQLEDGRIRYRGSIDGNVTMITGWQHGRFAVSETYQSSGSIRHTPTGRFMHAGTVFPVDHLPSGTPVWGFRGKAIADLVADTLSTYSAQDPCGETEAVVLKQVGPAAIGWLSHAIKCDHDGETPTPYRQWLSERSS